MKRTVKFKLTANRILNLTAETSLSRSLWRAFGAAKRGRRTANLRTKILDFRGFDSFRISILRDGFLVTKGNCHCLESLSQSILAGIILVGRLGVPGWSDTAARRARDRCARPTALAAEPPITNNNETRFKHSTQHTTRIKRATSTHQTSH